jgi:hypothetical protein
MAQRLLATRGGQLNADVLRHACHVLAFGRDISAMKLSNKQLDQVLAITTTRFDIKNHGVGDDEKVGAVVAMMTESGS